MGGRGHLLALLASLLITAAILILSPRAEALRGYGYAGVFLISLIGNATLILAAPYWVGILVLGATLNPLWVGLWSGLGMTLGEITGWLAGYGSRAALPDNRTYRRVASWMERHGVATIFLLALVPNPIMDLGGIAAGAAGMPAWKFLLAAWPGKTLRALLLAYTGLWGSEVVRAALHWLRALLGL